MIDENFLLELAWHIQHCQDDIRVYTEGMKKDFKITNVFDTMNKVAELQDNLDAAVNGLLSYIFENCEHY